MSHQPERKEKNCLNCGTTVTGRFCQKCGQENIEPKETVWHLVTHFFNDITHFDGKFFSTLKDLISKPGFLPTEYMVGKRASYLNPVRMYVFTSAIFFLLFFSVLRPDTGHVSQITVDGKTLEEIDRMDSASFAGFTARVNKEDNKPATPMSRLQFRQYIDSVTQPKLISSDIRSKKEYDSLLASGKRKDGWLTRQFIYKIIAIKGKYKTDNELTAAFVESLLHSLPQMFFVSLPLLALILKLLYVRRRNFYYVDHFIFSVHLYVFLFIDFLFLALLSKLHSDLGWEVFRIFTIPFAIGMFVYSFVALKNFYRQGWMKTILKYILLLVIFFIVLLVLFLIFVLLSFFKI